MPDWLFWPLFTVVVTGGLLWALFGGSRRRTIVTARDEIVPNDDPCERGRTIDFCAHVCERHGVHILAMTTAPAVAVTICRAVLAHLRAEAEDVLAEQGDEQ